MEDDSYVNHKLGNMSSASGNFSFMNQQPSTSNAEPDNLFGVKNGGQDIGTEDLEEDEREVSVQILDFDWIFMGKNSFYFLQMLRKTANDEIFGTEQIQVTVEVFWEKYSEAIYS